MDDRVQSEASHQAPDEHEGVPLALQVAARRCVLIRRVIKEAEFYGKARPRAREFGKPHCIQVGVRGAIVYIAKDVAHCRAGSMTSMQYELIPVSGGEPLAIVSMVAISLR